MTLFSAAMFLFLVMDPFGNIPCFLAALKNVEPARRSRIVARELLIALVIMIGFLFAGSPLLDVLQISEPALTATGGTVLFLIAIKMVFPPTDRALEDVEGEPFIVPLAVPYVAGPSALASILLIMNREPERWPEWLGALVLAWFACGIIIFTSGTLGRLLGDRILIAIERLMGMLLVAVAIQMLMTGIAQFMRAGGLDR